MADAAHPDAAALEAQVMSAVQAELERWRLQVLAEVSWRMSRAFADPSGGATASGEEPSGGGAPAAWPGIEGRMALADLEITSIKLDVCKLHDALRSQGARVEELAGGARCPPRGPRQPRGGPATDTGGELASIRAALEQVRASLLSARRPEPEAGPSPSMPASPAGCGPAAGSSQLGASVRSEAWPSPRPPASPSGCGPPAGAPQLGASVRSEAPAADAGGAGSGQPSSCASPVLSARQVCGRLLSGPAPRPVGRFSAPEAPQVRVMGPAAGPAVHYPAHASPRGTATPTAAGRCASAVAEDPPQSYGARPLTPVRFGQSAPMQLQRESTMFVHHSGPPTRESTMLIHPGSTGGPPPPTGGSGVPAVWRGPGAAAPAAAGRPHVRQVGTG